MYLVFLRSQKARVVGVKGVKEMTARAEFGRTDQIYLSVHH